MDFKSIDKQIRIVNEKRHKFWKEYRKLRRDFYMVLPKQWEKDPNWIDNPNGWEDDIEWQKRNRIIFELLRSVIYEELRRKEIRKREKKNIKSHVFVAVGLFKSDRLCVVCSLPLIGRQKKYCSQGCKSINDSRTYRKAHPERKARANYNYLKDILDDD